MGFLDKLMGRSKKAAGDVKGDSSMSREGAAQEQAAAEEHAEHHEELAQEQRDQAAQARAEQDQTP